MRIDCVENSGAAPVYKHYPCNRLAVAQKIPGTTLNLRNAGSFRGEFLPVFARRTRFFDDLRHIGQAFATLWAAAASLEYVGDRPGTAASRGKVFVP